MSAAISANSLSRTEFTLVKDPNTSKMVHQHNWVVHRTPEIRSTLKALWGNGESITNKRTMEKANNSQKVCKYVNVLFRNMELAGPSRTEFLNFKYDSKNDFYHCHVKMGLTYVILWEADPETKTINIVALDSHKAFKLRGYKFKRSVHKTISMNKCFSNSEISNK